VFSSVNYFVINLDTTSYGFTVAIYIHLGCSRIKMGTGSHLRAVVPPEKSKVLPGVYGVLESLSGGVLVPSEGGDNSQEELDEESD